MTTYSSSVGSHPCGIDAPLSPLAIVVSDIDANYYELHRRHGWYGLFLVDIDGNLHDIGIWFRGEYDRVIAQVQHWTAKYVHDGKVIINKPFRPHKRERR